MFGYLRLGLAFALGHQLCAALVAQVFLNDGFSGAAPLRGVVSLTEKSDLQCGQLMMTFSPALTTGPLPFGVLAPSAATNGMVSAEDRMPRTSIRITVLIWSLSLCGLN